MIFHILTIFPEFFRGPFEHGVLGKAILRTDPGNPNHADLFGLAFPEPTVARNASPSVVLIDEIDKASRDFPNDLLNGIERLEFSLKELRNRPVRVADDPDGRALWPTLEEKAYAEAAREREAKEREREAKDRAIAEKDAALAELAALRAELASRR